MKLKVGMDSWFVLFATSTCKHLSEAKESWSQSLSPWSITFFGANYLCPTRKKKKRIS